MNFADIFVALISILAGGVLAGAGVFRWEWFFELSKVRWLEARAGAAGARWILALLGLSFIALGAAIALGFGPNAG